MQPTLRATVLVAGLAWWVTSPAWAGPKEDAKRTYLEAQAAWKAGDPEQAASLFSQAYKLYSSPAIALGLARAQYAAGQYAKSVASYELYERDKGQLRADLVVDVAQELGDARARLVQGARVSTPTGDRTAAAGATQAEIARLQAIAEELVVLSRDIGSREASPVARPPTESDTPVAVEPPPSASAAPMEQLGLFDEETRSVSRYGQPLLEAPATVSIITAEDIRMSGATNIPDVLRRVVGVDVMQLSSAQPELSIRGFNRALSNKVLVLVDGRSVYQDIMATPLWAVIPVALEEIERIEVVRGPASAVYGANAVTGVINIITRAPGQGKDLVHVETGSPEHARGTVIVSGRSGDTSAKLVAGYHRTGRWATGAPITDEGPWVPYLEDQSRSMGVVMANGRIDHQLANDVLLSVSGGYAGGTSEFYVFSRLGDFAIDFDSIYARADLNAGPIHARAFVNTFDADVGPWASLVGDTAFNTFVDSETVDGEVEAIQQFEGDSVDHHIVAGVGYRYKSIQWGYLQDQGQTDLTEQHLRVFVQEEAAVGELRDGGWRPFRMVGSLRFDKHPLVDDPLQTISPRGAAVWRFAEGRSARVTGGTAFRAPSQMESYLDLYQPVSGASGVAVQTLGDDSGLVPERVLTIEAGLHDESSDIHSADVTVYTNKVTNLIWLTDVVPVESRELSSEHEAFVAGTTSFYNEAEIYRGVGVEADARLFPVNGLDLYTNLAVGRIMRDDGGVKTPDSSMSSVKVNAGVLVRTPWRTDVATHAHYQSAQTWTERDFDDSGAVYEEDLPIPGRTVLVGKVVTRPFPEEDVELGLTGWNLLALADGGRFKEHPLGQSVGARWFGSATWRF